MGVFMGELKKYLWNPIIFNRVLKTSTPPKSKTRLRARFFLLGMLPQNGELAVSSISRPVFTTLPNHDPMDSVLPSIPAKRYFTIGEVAELCGVKTHVLRYWEQEFTQLRPVKRRGNRRYYQHHEVLMIRRIRDLLYEQGFTISGARNKLQELAQSGRQISRVQGEVLTDDIAMEDGWDDELPALPLNVMGSLPVPSGDLKKELLEIRLMLTF